YGKGIWVRNKKVVELRGQEYLNGGIRRAWPGKKKTTLGLEVRETPTFHERDPSQWVTFKPKWYGSSRQIKPTLDLGKSTFYMSGTYLQYKDKKISVPATTRKITGFDSVVNRGTGGLSWVVDQYSEKPLIIERFGYGVTIEHRSRRTLVIRHGKYRYIAGPNAGDLYVEDAILGRLILQPKQKVWMRQYNTEFRPLHVTNNNAQLWILGIKTEGKGTIIETLNGGKTEVFGTLLYPLGVFNDKDKPAFVSVDSQISLMYGLSANVFGSNYITHVRETRKGVSKSWNSTHKKGRFFMPLYVGAP
ncbi:MAG: hypothetical protein AAGJ35_16225, partial [Myxococcota bacterium]